AATLEKIGLLANEKQISLFAACCESELSMHLSARSQNAVQQFAKWISLIADNAQRADPAEAIRNLIRQSHYEAWLFESSTSPKAAEMALKNINELYRWISEMLEGKEDEPAMTLPEVVTRLTLRDMMERQEQEDNAD